MNYFKRLRYYRHSKRLLDKTRAISKELEIPLDEAFLRIDPVERHGKTYFIIYYEAAAYHIDLSMGLAVSSATMLTIYVGLLIAY